MLAVFIVRAIRAGYTPKQLDAGVVQRIDAQRENRDAMEVMEKAYQDASKAKQQALDTVVRVLEATHMTLPGNTDTAVLRYLKDIQEPGAPKPIGIDDIYDTSYDGITTPPSKMTDYFYQTMTNGYEYDADRGLWVRKDDPDAVTDLAGGDDTTLPPEPEADAA